ncbi:MAG: ABC transporter ATP-binding protein [Bacillaceae bacterium]|nr:ABC transporter ATP-binding protein [Bacillaceae bacterium]
MEPVDKLLEINDLHVSFYTYGGEVQAIRGASFHVNKGETLAIVGESGSGKSVTAQAVMGLIPSPPGKIKQGEILFNGENIVHYSEKQMQNIRGSQISMIFQDPMTSLNPTMKIGRQITEGIIKHEGLTKKQAQARAIELLKMVNIPNAEERIDQYPHQFSGGMRQRVMIAIALACNPQLLIADEPTTALDVTIQAQILELMKDLQKEIGTSIIMITHDLGVVANVADRVAVMYAGKIIESGTVDEIFYSPQHPYTWGLLQSVPRLDSDRNEKLVPIDGTPPDLLDPPKGCPFAARCEYAMKVCLEEQPDTTVKSDSHRVNCWLQHEHSPQVEAPVAMGGSES